MKRTTLMFTQARRGIQDPPVRLTHPIPPVRGATRSRIKTRIDWRYWMPRLPALLGSVLALGFAACRGDVPTAPRNLAAPDSRRPTRRIA